MNPGPLDCKSEALPTKLCWPLGIILFKDVNEIYSLSNYVMLMIKMISVPKTKWIIKLPLTKKGPGDHLVNVCDIK